MASLNDNHISFPPASVRSPTVVEIESASPLTAAVDGGIALTTATAAGQAIRSRSRSPRPAPSHTILTKFGDVETIAASKQDGLFPSHGADFASRPGGNSFELHSLPHSTNLSSDRPLYQSELNQHAASLHNHHDQSFGARLTLKWESSKGLLMVVLAMFFSAAMGAIARVMQLGPSPMQPMQILFVRQSITAGLSLLFMWWRQTPDAPYGRREVRPLLVARGVGGFFGVFGLYYSVKYLPLAEAVVITFLAPMVANGVCSVFLKEPFTRREQLAGVISMLGVVFIARPTSFFGPGDADDSGQGPADDKTTQDSVDQGQRLVAIGVALLGVCGAACAYTTIRWIGKRAHPLISVTYFSVWCTFVSLAALLIMPNISFRLPSDLREWVLLISLGISGMALQFLLTAGLARQKGSAATNMAYTQMIFVLLIDYVVFGSILTWASWVGAALILGSQIWASISRSEASKQQAPGDTTQRVRDEEEIGLVETQANDESDDEVGTHSGAEGTSTQTKG